ncbi:hypothetical protein Bhyg_00954 [Pseudolycoriella hygida]|uniref:Uncharacterized protein n=1 Tax=Pseudolycoriella hygida TaxID=35572 RepID=A0A9Q0S726_9DIPT|nr:hypothetical protein Bhyg_00954 [Pseudolycoriella hygida]
MSILKNTRSNSRFTRTTTYDNNYPNDKEMKTIDEQSLMGRFGWPENDLDPFAGIPYILRDIGKYFAVDMILEKEPIKTYISCLNKDVYSYYITVTTCATKAESNLLNEINKIHCDNQLGLINFTTESLLIKDTDAYSFHEFLDTCCNKLFHHSKAPSNKIGFLRFSDSLIFVPFVSHNKDRYLPFFCFSNANNLKIEFIFGWDFAYLKFCCMYQGTWKGSYDMFPVIALSSLQDHLPADTHWEVCWPQLQTHNLLYTSPSIKNLKVNAKRSRKIQDTTTAKPSNNELQKDTQKRKHNG